MPKYVIFKTARRKNIFLVSLRDLKYSIWREKKQEEEEDGEGKKYGMSEGNCFLLLLFGIGYSKTVQWCVMIVSSKASIRYSISFWYNLWWEKYYWKLMCQWPVISQANQNWPIISTFFYYYYTWLQWITLHELRFFWILVEECIFVVVVIVAAINHISHKNSVHQCVHLSLNIMWWRLCPWEMGTRWEKYKREYG